MDNLIKKDLASNWFKLLQNTICNDILELENNKIKFESTIINKRSLNAPGRQKIGLASFEALTKRVKHVLNTIIRYIGKFIFVFQTLVLFGT